VAVVAAERRAAKPYPAVPVEVIVVILQLLHMPTARRDKETGVERVAVMGVVVVVVQAV
jgi:hypothetical protein